jgi:protein TonB
MSRGKLLLLTLGISSSIHLALAAAYLWQDKSISTPSGRAVVEISLQQAATSKATSPAVQQPAPFMDEPLLSSQQDKVNQHVIADTENMPEPQPAEPIEADPEPVAAPSVQAPSTDTAETLAQSAAAETGESAPARLQTARTGQLKAEHSTALEAEKQNYLGLVAEHINSYKYYPRNAIRRGTEGQVEVSFDLQPDGSIENLHTRGEHSVLLSASQRSIEQALPMPQRSENLLALGAIHIEFSMKYFLHEQ